MSLEGTSATTTLCSSSIALPMWMISSAPTAPSCSRSTRIRTRTPIRCARAPRRAVAWPLPVAALLLPSVCLSQLIRFCLSCFVSLAAALCDQEDFRRVQQAFNTLSNAELRSNYDATYAPEQSMMDQIEGDDMFKCYVELKKYPPHHLPPLPSLRLSRMQSAALWALIVCSES